jgi:hypothetical protein
MRKGDIFGIGNRNYVITGDPEYIGNAGRELGEIKNKGKVRKVTLYIGMDRGVDSGRCKTQPKEYDPQTVVDEFITLREIQTGDSEKVGATTIPARGVYKGGGEESRVIEVIFERNNKEKSFEKFKNNMLKTGEVLSRRFCQREIKAIVKNGTDEVEWQLTPKRKKK